MGRRASALGGLLLLTGCGSEVHTTVGGDVAGLRTGLLQVEPAEIHLGHVAPGEEPVVELVLRNPGTQVVGVTDLGLAGDALGFSLPEPPSLPLEVEPGDEIRVPVRFRAWDGRTVVARLELRSDASNAPWIVVPLSAQGDTRRLRVEPVPLDLGEVQVGCDAVGLLELVGAGSSAVRVDAVRGELPEGLSLTSALSLPRDLARDQR
ncbi:MAG: hypothetical protein KC656_21100, partial [Myxococcales bacterium]|nr:hypothetical protein [Myxococcales bacterium]